MPGFSGQGKVSLGFRLASGKPDVMRWIGNASVFQLGQSADRVERKESFSGNRNPYRAMTATRGGTMKITFDEWNNDNMRWIAQGDIQQVNAGTFTDWVAPTSAMKAGDQIMLPWRDITIAGTGIKDSAGTPATIPQAKWKITEGKTGVELLENLTTNTAPLKLTGSYAAHQVMGAFNMTNSEVYVRFEGTNTDTGEWEIVDVFRMRLDPAKQIDLINNDNFADFELDGTLLLDSTRTANGAGGQMWQVLRKTGLS